MRGRAATAALAGTEDPTLGVGVIAGPGPPAGQAVDGEPPIEQTTDPRIARLARRFQPTLEVSVADRFWPVSVGAVLGDIGPDGTRACLVTPAVSPACKPVTSVPATGQPNDYLRFPTTANVDASALTENPAAQFRAFEAGQHTSRARCITGSPIPASSTPGGRPRCTSTTAGPCTSPASAANCRRGRR